MAGASICNNICGVCDPTIVFNKSFLANFDKFVQHIAYITPNFKPWFKNGYSSAIISNRYPWFLVESLKLEDKLLFVVKKSGLH